MYCSITIQPKPTQPKHTVQSTFEKTDMRHDQQAGLAGGEPRLGCYHDDADGEQGVLHHHFD